MRAIDSVSSPEMALQMQQTLACDIGEAVACNWIEHVFAAPERIGFLERRRKMMRHQFVPPRAI
jgi:hypothetical protein